MEPHNPRPGGTCTKAQCCLLCKQCPFRPPKKCLQELSEGIESWAEKLFFSSTAGLPIAGSVVGGGWGEDWGWVGCQLHGPIIYSQSLCAMLGEGGRMEARAEAS